MTSKTTRAFAAAVPDMVRRAGTRSHRIILTAILLLGLCLRLWNLSSDGWGAEYYTAAVRSMALNWHNFFYAAFDPSGFIAVDKPPVALWIQVGFVKLLGFRPLAVLLPQVIEGVASIALLYHLVTRSFGARAGLWAALFLAVTPISIAVNRTNNMDSFLALVLLLAAWSLLNAIDSGRRRYLFLTMAIVGIAFNVKMLAAYLILPPIGIAYTLYAPNGLARRLRDLLLSSGILVAISLLWVTAVELTPAESRPYIGSTTSNSMLELVIGHNARDRFLRPAGATSVDTATSRSTPQVEIQAGGDDFSDVRTTARRIARRLFVLSRPGPGRLFQGQLAAQVNWLLPLGAADCSWPLWDGQTPAGAPFEDRLSFG